jgi:tRNA(Ile)-lysidine synthetase-like protein
VLALAAAVPEGARAARLAVAHVVHDLRPRDEALADAYRTRALAERVGVPYHQVEVTPAASSPRANQEAAARAARYRALAELAKHYGAAFIATAHHADDQAETIVLRLLRGAAVGGLVGIHPSRVIDRAATPPIVVIRPMLGVRRADAERICGACGVGFAVDATNADTTRARAWARHVVMPLLDARAPGATLRIAALADHARDVREVVSDAVRTLWQHAAHACADGSIELDRAALRTARPALVAAVLRRAARVVAGTQPRRLDALSSRVTREAAAIVRDRRGGSRVITLGPATLTVTRDRVLVRPRVMPEPAPATGP